MGWERGWEKTSPFLQSAAGVPAGSANQGHDVIVLTASCDAMGSHDPLRPRPAHTILSKTKRMYAATELFSLGKIHAGRVVVCLGVGSEGSSQLYTEVCTYMYAILTGKHPSIPYVFLRPPKVPASLSSVPCVAVLSLER